MNILLDKKYIDQKFQVESERYDIEEKKINEQKFELTFRDQEKSISIEVKMEDFLVQNVL